MEVSISFTTYSNKVDLAEKSLFEISKWKNESHQFLVACHDATRKMKNLLDHYKSKKIINDLFYTPSNFGHLKGVNLCLENARCEYFFNINHDVLVKDICVINDCKDVLSDDKNGMVGWFWVGKGCYWEKDKLKFTLRNKKIQGNYFYDDPKELTRALKKNNVKNVVPDQSWVWCCNTSFFGIKTSLFREIGGFNSQDFTHGYADDYITYQLLEKKVNVINMPKHLYKKCFFDSLTSCKWHKIEKCKFI